ncbi:MAG: nucleoside-diphosphate sugar epimerase [Chloroflexi bacterium HGW-Chloroflexi-1]|nr:MAG: nucleoside-diphosphate sugar epimerase [Chloroflexi bacterium HGW-Chloroflexi-1]
MKALITGGAGFIGSHLAERLLAAGYRVVAIDDLSTGSEANIRRLLGRADFQFVLETITNETVMDRLVSECDIIFHLAAAVGVELIVRDPVHTIETNVLGTGTVLRIANRYRRKTILASTSEIYGKSNDAPFREDGDRVMGPTTRSRWAYANSKAMDEFLALAYHKQRGLPVVICRFFNTIGPRQTGRYGMVVPRFVRQALAGEPLTVYGDGSQSRCFADVADVTGAVLRLAEHAGAVGQVFNLGSTEEITILDLARRVIALTGSRSEIVLVPYEEAYEPGFEDMHRRVPDISRAAALIEYRPRCTLDDTLRRIIAHFREFASV